MTTQETKFLSLIGCPSRATSGVNERNGDVTPIGRTLELPDLLQERIEHLVVVFGGENVRLEGHF